jgi:hypothetical protein
LRKQDKKRNETIFKETKFKRKNDSFSQKKKSQKMLNFFFFGNFRHGHGLKLKISSKPDLAWPQNQFLLFWTTLWPTRLRVKSTRHVIFYCVRRKRKIYCLRNMLKKMVQIHICITLAIMNLTIHKYIKNYLDCAVSNRSF